MSKPEQVLQWLENAGAEIHPRELGICQEEFKISIIAAKDIRKRYGILQLLEDLGILEDIAEIVTRIYYDII